MTNDKFLYVFLKDTLVRTLSLTSKNQVAFKYDNNWLKNGFSISPFSLPLEKSFYSNQNTF